MRIACVALAVVAVWLPEGAHAQNSYGRQTLHGAGTGWWDKEGFPLAAPLESCRQTSVGHPKKCTWMVSLKQPAAGSASFELIDLNSDGWSRSPFTISAGRVWEFDVIDTSEERYDPKWVLRTDSTEPWTLVFTKKEASRAYFHEADFTAEFKVNAYRKPDTTDPFESCERTLCVGQRFGGQPASWPSRKAALFWAFDPENPEALVKVLDGRSINGHWWLDLAVTSDLYTTTIVHSAGVWDQGWVFLTGTAAAFGVTGEYADRLIHCFYPYKHALRAGQYQCWKAGMGTSVSLRDLWDGSGRIPSRWCDWRHKPGYRDLYCFKPPGLEPPRIP